MNDLNALVFSSLFKDAYLKCFGYPLRTPLSETESKLFYNQILEQTGLVIGSKSIKNYSFYIINNTAGKQENPSIATLDTLARYVLNAPYTDEIQRKNKENHYPYWFQYKDQFHRSSKKTVPGKRSFVPVIFIAASGLIVILLVIWYLFQTKKFEQFTDDFHSVAEDSLMSRGWFVKSKDTAYWNRRSEKPAHLSLFTLRGDNSPDSANAPGIKNFLLRKIPSDCFIAEIHLANFIPKQNWQQAGILILEDTNFTGKSVRLSLAYNDFFGGYSKPREIIIQAITSYGNGSKPEEIAHIPIFNIEQGHENLINNNLQKSALRIEKHGTKIRLLYTVGQMEDFAFKEAVSREFDMEPKYIGLFALQGFVNDTNCIPAWFNFFSLTGVPCNK